MTPRISFGLDPGGGADGGGHQGLDETRRRRRPRQPAPAELDGRARRSPSWTSWSTPTRVARGRGEPSRSCGGCAGTSATACAGAGSSACSSPTSGANREASTPNGTPSGIAGSGSGWPPRPAPRSRSDWPGCTGPRDRPAWRPGPPSCRAPRSPSASCAACERPCSSSAGRPTRPSGSSRRSKAWPDSTATASSTTRAQRGGGGARRAGLVGGSSTTSRGGGPAGAGAVSRCGGARW